MPASALALPFDELLTPSPADRRAHVRVAADHLPWVKSARLKYGPPLSLIDLSVGGAQVETDASLRPGSSLVVQIQGEDDEIAVASQVVRSHITSLFPTATYRSALAFKRALHVPGLETAADGKRSINAVHEFARLTLALKRRSPASDVRATDAAPVTEVSQAVLTAASIALEVQRGGAAAGHELGALIRDVVRGVEQGDALPALLDRIGQRLWHSAGVRTRIVDGARSRLSAPADALEFELAAVGDHPAGRLIVDAVRDGRRQEADLQLLKAAAQLVALVRDVYPPLEKPAAAVTASAAAQGYAKIVVRYLDGRLLKGYTNDLPGTKTYFHFASTPHAPQAARISVPIRQVKAVFFVRDFEGSAEYIESKDFGEKASGRRVAVTFLDDEVLIGTTLNYRPDGDGFFVVPADPKSNNERVFVVSHAVRQLQFL
jgi:hypothetical protein